MVKLVYSTMDCWSGCNVLLSLKYCYTCVSFGRAVGRLVMHRVWVCALLLGAESPSFVLITRTTSPPHHFAYLHVQAELVTRQRSFTSDGYIYMCRFCYLHSVLSFFHSTEVVFMAASTHRTLKWMVFILPLHQPLHAIRTRWRTFELPSTLKSIYLITWEKTSAGDASFHPGWIFISSRSFSVQKLYSCCDIGNF